MRILVSSPTFLPAVGGAELGIHEIYDRLGRDHDVVVLAPKPGNQDPHVAEDHYSDNYRVERLLPELDNGVPAIVRRGARRAAAGYLWEFDRQVRKHRPDVMNPHFLMRQALPALATGRRFDIPVVFSLVGRPDVVPKQALPKRLVSRFALRRSAKNIAITRYCLEGEASLSDAVVVPYGVDLEHYRPAARSEATREALGLSPDDIGVLTVQRLAKVKRVDVLLYALAKALSSEPRLKLVVAGKGEELDSLKQLAERLSIGSRVHFAGYVPEEKMGSLYASCDLFAFHSMSETFGIVFAQAMATALPIVAADTSCVSEVVRPGTGTLFAPFDIDALGTALINLAADESGRAAIGAAGRARAEQAFSWDEIASQYERVLASAAQR